MEVDGIFSLETGDLLEKTTSSLFTKGQAVSRQDKHILQDSLFSLTTVKAMQYQSASGTIQLPDDSVPLIAAPLMSLLLPGFGSSIVSGNSSEKGLGAMTFRGREDYQFDLQFIPKGCFLPCTITPNYEVGSEEACETARTKDCFSSNKFAPWRPVPTRVHVKEALEIQQS